MSLAAFLFAFAHASPPAPVFEATLHVEAAAFSTKLDPSRAPATAPADEGLGVGGADLRIYPGGRLGVLVDDPTPRALQPFLQRVGSVHVQGGLGTALHVGDAGESLLRYTSGAPRGQVGFGVDAYAHRMVPVRVELAAATDGTKHEVAGLATVGARIWNVRLDAGATLSTDGTLFAPRFYFAARAVLLQRIDVHFQLQTLHDAWDRRASEAQRACTAPGAQASFDVAYYATPSLGLRVGLRGGEGPDSADGGAHTTTLGVRAGFSYWPAPSFGLVAEYRPTWVTETGAGFLDHRALVELSLRR